MTQPTEVNSSGYDPYEKRTATTVEQKALITSEDAGDILAPTEPSTDQLVAIELKDDDLARKRWLRKVA